MFKIFRKKINSCVYYQKKKKKIYQKKPYNCAVFLIDFVRAKKKNTLKKMIIDSVILSVMSDTRNTLFVFFAALLIVLMMQWLYKFYRQCKTLPPGPWGIPIFGYLMFMGSEKHTSFMELAKSYGTVYSARLGYQLTVVLSDYKMIREAFRREEFTGRPDTPFLKTLKGFGEFEQNKLLFFSYKRELI